MLAATVDRRAHMADDVGSHGSFPRRIRATIKSIGRISMRTFDRNSYRTGPVENRNVTAHPSEDDDPRLRDLAVAVVDDEVIRSPKPQRSLGKAGLPRGF